MRSTYQNANVLVNSIFDNWRKQLTNNNFYFHFLLDCVLVGSMYWGLWVDYTNPLNYYRAYITKLNDTHVDFVLEINKQQTRNYRRTEPVLIIDDKISDMKNVAVNATVIAQHRRDHPEWYQTGTVIGTWGTSFVTVKFDDGVTKWVRLENLRLVKRPRFCVDNM